MCIPSSSFVHSAQNTCAAFRTASSATCWASSDESGDRGEAATPPAEALSATVDAACAPFELASVAAACWLRCKDGTGCCCCDDGFAGGIGGGNAAVLGGVKARGMAAGIGGTGVGVEAKDGVGRTVVAVAVAAVGRSV